VQVFSMEVMIVDKEDYTHYLRSIYGVKASQHEVSKADLVIDRETGKILKSRYF